MRLEYSAVVDLYTDLFHYYLLMALLGRVGNTLRFECL